MNYSKFTPEFKDSVLKYLCESLPTYALCSIDLTRICDDFDLLNACLNNFKERGLIKDLNLKRNYCGLILTSRAIDFLNLGGFSAEYEIFDIQMSKAILELEKLQSDPSFKDHIDKISGIAGIITNAITAFNTLTGR